MFRFIERFLLGFKVTENTFSKKFMIESVNYLIITDEIFLKAIRTRTKQVKKRLQVIAN